MKKHITKYGWLHLMVLPGLIFFLLFKYVPMYGIIIAFKNYQPANGFWGIIKAPNVCFKHFESFFSSMYFTRLLGNTLTISLLKLAISFPMPILFALMINEIRHTAFKRTVQTISYMPHFLSWVVLASLIKILFSTDDGPIIVMINKLFGYEMGSVLKSKTAFVPLLVISDIYKTVGWGSIIYLAAISGINEELYDAALIDGANRRQQMFHITLPAIAEIIVVFLILRVGTLMSENFEQIFNLYSPSVYAVADVFETFTYRAGLEDAKYSFAAAVGLFQGVIGLVLVVLSNSLSHKLGSEGLW